MMRKIGFGIFILIMAGVFLATLSACGGGGGSGGGPRSNLYKVSVEVSGLQAGESIVLQNNGADDLQIDADGSYTFATGIEDGAQYQVTVSSQPAGRVTTVVNGSGKISGSDASGILVKVMTWSAPQTIGPEDVSGQNIRVAMDPGGEAVVVWKQYDSNGEQRITKSEYRNGTWSHPADRDDNISSGLSDSKEPSVAMAANGDALVAWVQKDANGIWQVFKSGYRNGTWSHPDPADLSDNISPDGQNARYVRVAMAANGDAIIVWQQKDSNGDWQVFKSECRSGTWSHPAGLDDHISFAGHDVYSSPDVAMAANGEAVIVWGQQTSSAEYRIFKSEYRNGSWHPPADEDDHICPDFGFAYAPSVAMAADGDTVIAWEQSSLANGWQIYKSEYRNGSWSHPAGEDDYISCNTFSGFIYQPRVAMSAKAEALIVWMQKVSNGDQRIFKSEYRNGTWTHPADENDSISPQGDVQYSEYRAAMAADGDSVIVWSQQDSNNVEQIFRSEYRNGSWSHPADTDDNISPDGHVAYVPYVAMSDHGEAIVVWWQTGDTYVTHCH